MVLVNYYLYQILLNNCSKNIYITLLIIVKLFNLLLSTFSNKFNTPEIYIIFFIFKLLYFFKIITN